MKKDHQKQKNQKCNGLLTYDEHLEVLRQMLLRIIIVVGLLSVAVFCFKDSVWKILLAPSEWDFCTYVFIENVLHKIGINFRFDEFYVDMIATDLSSQFMTHVTTSIYLGLLGTSPYILYEIFRFISPALYENERNYSLWVIGIVYNLFVLGVLMSYFILFPISFRFLGTYSVAPKIVSNITLDSYIDTFLSLTLIMGIVFQLPVISFCLGKLGLLNSEILTYYRKHSFLIIMLVAAIITPPDIMTLILVTIPLYILYEISIKVLEIVENRREQ